MKRLKPSNVKLDLTEYGVEEKFEIFELGNYKFSENLDFEQKKGIYIFTKRDAYSTHSKLYQREVYYHELIYCGMTCHTETRFDDHSSKECINKNKANRVCLYFCDNCKESELLEDKVLHLIDFICNTDKNTDDSAPNRAMNAKGVEVL